jgi:hypothetical protein
VRLKGRLRRARKVRIRGESEAIEEGMRRWKEEGMEVGMGGERKQQAAQMT